jgi:hypothetical protein
LNNDAIFVKKSTYQHLSTEVKNLLCSLSPLCLGEKSSLMKRDVRFLSKGLTKAQRAQRTIDRFDCRGGAAPKNLTFENRPAGAMMAGWAPLISISK